MRKTHAATLPGRRRALAMMAGASVGLGMAGWGLSATNDAQSAPQEPLGELAARAGLQFGASIAGEALSDAGYRRLYLEHARILTSDLALKFAILRPDRGAPRYEDADALVAFAAANKMPFRGHCLIWNESNPDWIKSLGKAEMAELLDRHVDATVRRYKGRVHSWDVVNEPFWPDHGAPGGYRNGPWHNALGPGYIARALRIAAAADPSAKLVVNEAFTERGDALGLAARAGMLRLIDDLRKQDVPLHAIGLEAHLQPQFKSDDDGFVRFLKEIAGRGLDIYLTELDIDDASLPRDIGLRDKVAAARVGAFLQRALSVPAVKVLECWQLSDRYSWYADPSMLRARAAGDLPRPLPFDRYFTRKPMYDAIANALRARSPA